MFAGTHLGIKDHSLFGKIENHIQAAEVAQQLMTSKKPEDAPEGLAEFLSRKSENKRAELKKDKEEALDDKQSREIYEFCFPYFFELLTEEYHLVDDEKILQTVESITHQVLVQLACLASTCPNMWSFDSMNPKISVPF